MEIGINITLQPADDPFVIVVANSGEIESDFVLRVLCMSMSFSILVPRGMREWIDKEIRSWYTRSVEGEWKSFNAGGATDVNWLNNLQYPLYITEPTWCKIMLTNKSSIISPFGFYVVTEQPNNREDLRVYYSALLGSESTSETKRRNKKRKQKSTGAPMQPYERSVERVNRYSNVLLEHTEIVGRSRIPCTREMSIANEHKVECRVYLHDPDIPYFIIPYMNNMSSKGSYTVQVFSENKLKGGSMRPIPPPLETKGSLDFAVGKFNAGGFDHEDTLFYKNPHFIITVTPQDNRAVTRLLIEITFSTTEKMESGHLWVFKGTAFCRQRIRELVALTDEIEPDNNINLIRRKFDSETYSLEIDMLPGEYSIVIPCKVISHDFVENSGARFDFKVSYPHLTSDVLVHPAPTCFIPFIFEDEHVSTLSTKGKWQDLSAAGAPPPSIMGEIIVSHAILLLGDQKIFETRSGDILDKPRFLDNPQILFSISGVSQAKVEISMDRSGSVEWQHMMFIVFRVPSTFKEHQRLEQVNMSDVVAVTRFTDGRYTSILEQYTFANWDFNVSRKGRRGERNSSPSVFKFVLVACCEVDGRDADFSISIRSQPEGAINVIILPEITRHLFEYSGSWDEGITGGHMDDISFRNNPLYKIRTKVPDTRILCRLIPHRSDSSSTVLHGVPEVALFMMQTSKEIRDMDPVWECVNRSPWSDCSGGISFFNLLQEAEQEYDLVLSTLHTGIEADYSLLIASTKELSIQEKISGEDQDPRNLPCVKYIVSRWPSEIYVPRDGTRTSFCFEYSLKCSTDQPTQVHLELRFQMSPNVRDRESKVTVAVDDKRMRDSEPFATRQCLLSPCQVDPYIVVFDIGSDEDILSGLKMGLLVAVLTIRSSHGVVIRDRT